eukprot:snap_masked-scaffold_28-processed-gene-1.18-mRNA-1 protein AED:1.00 eAED:1.00 QI:0/0/0/0/1/1/3/0/343
MAETSNCEAPFLFEEGDCNSTVAEFYEPFSYYLRVGSTSFDVLVVLILSAILISFLKAHATEWMKTQEPTSRTSSGKRNYFFKYNLLTILFLLTATVFHTYLCYHNFLYDVDFSSLQGKRNSLCVVYMIVFYYTGTFCFLPILKELLGLSKIEPKYEKIQNISLFLSVIATLPYAILMPFLIYMEKLTLSEFILISFLHGMIKGILLSLVLYFVVDLAIKEIQNLTNHYIQAGKSSKEMNRIYLFHIKVKALKVEICFHTIIITLITIPNLIPNTIYLTVIPVEVMPSYFFFSSERCFSFDPDKSGIFSSSRRTRNNLKFSEKAERETSITIKRGSNEINISL